MIFQLFFTSYWQFLSLNIERENVGTETGSLENRICFFLNFIYGLIRIRSIWTRIRSWKPSTHPLLNLCKARLRCLELFCFNETLRNLKIYLKKSCYKSKKNKLAHLGAEAAACGPAGLHGRRTSGRGAGLLRVLPLPQLHETRDQAGVHQSHQVGNIHFEISQIKLQKLSRTIIWCEALDWIFLKKYFSYWSHFHIWKFVDKYIMCFSEDLYYIKVFYLKFC